MSGSRLFNLVCQASVLESILVLILTLAERVAGAALESNAALVKAEKERSCRYVEAEVSLKIQPMSVHPGQRAWVIPQWDRLRLFRNGPKTSGDRLRRHVQERSGV
jgi:hypothetical protein